MNQVVSVEETVRQAEQDLLAGEILRVFEAPNPTHNILRYHGERESYLPVFYLTLFQEWIIILNNGSIQDWR